MQTRDGECPGSPTLTESVCFKRLNEPMILDRVKEVGGAIDMSSFLLVSAGCSKTLIRRAWKDIFQKLLLGGESPGPSNLFKKKNEGLFVSKAGSPRPLGLESEQALGPTF